jgi:hypothetical protein
MSQGRIGTLWLGSGIVGLVVNGVLLLVACAGLREPYGRALANPPLAFAVLLEGAGPLVLAGGAVVWFYTLLLRAGLDLRAGRPVSVWPVTVGASVALAWNVFAGSGLVSVGLALLDAVLIVSSFLVHQPAAPVPRGDGAALRRGAGQGLVVGAVAVLALNGVLVVLNWVAFWCDFERLIPPPPGVAGLPVCCGLGLAFLLFWFLAVLIGSGRILHDSTLSPVPAAVRTVVPVGGGLLVWNVIAWLGFAAAGIDTVTRELSLGGLLYLGCAVVSLGLVLAYGLLIVSAVLLTGLPLPVPATLELTADLKQAGTIWLVAGSVGLGLNVLLLVLITAALATTVSRWSLPPFLVGLFLFGAIGWFYLRLIQAGRAVRAGARRGLARPARQLVRVAGFLLVWNLLDCTAFWAVGSASLLTVPSAGVWLYPASALVSVGLALVDVFLIVSGTMLVRFAIDKRSG